MTVIRSRSVLATWAVERCSVSAVTARLARIGVQASSSKCSASIRSLHSSTSSSAVAEPTITASGAVDAGNAEVGSGMADTPARTEPAASWTPSSKRVGLIAKKIGMTSYFMPDGRRVPATVLQVSSNQISAHIGFSSPTHLPTGEPIAPRKIQSRLAYTALQVAATNTASRHGITKAERGHLRKAGIKQAKKVLHEFRVTKDAIVPLGTYLSAAHFVPGQMVDAKAKSRGKGFQGAMKRHGFHGLRASHGVSVSHRSHGSTGQNQDPGRVFPGKKMAGRMGGKFATKQNLEVLRIDTVNDVIIVQGNVPGPEGGHVYMTDATKALVRRAAGAYKLGVLPATRAMATGAEGADAYLPAGVADLPFPAGTRSMAKDLPEIIEVGPKSEGATV